jgi:hypothetical protein
MNTEVQHLSHSFRTDAAHLITKAHCANDHAKAPNKRTSYIAKLIIDAYMACECALKSMIASSNANKTGVEVYRMIRHCGHDFRHLIKEAKPKKTSRADLDFLKQASKRGVNLRYSLDLFSLSNCDFIPNDSVGFHPDQPYLLEFLRIAEVLRSEADEHHFALGTTVTLKSSRELLKYVQRLRKITAKEKPNKSRSH